MEERGLGSAHREVVVSVRASRGGISAHAKVKALALGGDLSQATSLCMDSAANFRAMELQHRICKTEGKENQFALYAIGPDDGPVKIGHACDPHSRLIGLQIGNWNELKVHGLLWSDYLMRDVEALALKAAAEMGVNLRGEWVDLEPRDAVELALKAARYANRKVYDSAVWIENWPIRCEAISEAKRAVRRIEARAAA